ncbi:lipid storage droplets surface-binding protein 1 [Nilaparvata lugens]|uniref:lipid storage droplets surface-binding protein 1 n=1 Tax=Nilaparvata lugens TaxID=108931 RepID=UPI000B98D29D|nr:lipid storage droplets surface-binding protein 1 [Nilaparvata lugens]
MADNKSIEGPTGMCSINRVAKLPVVESTWNAASGMYSKVKESNSFFNNVLSTAESTMQSAVQATQPITQSITDKLEKPIKSVDSVLCSGLDYVEDKIPGIKSPPSEMYENTKNLVYRTVQPAVKCVCDNVQLVSTALSHPCQAGEQCIRFIKNGGNRAVQDQDEQKQVETATKKD